MTGLVQRLARTAASAAVLLAATLLLLVPPLHAEAPKTEATPNCAEVPLSTGVDDDVTAADAANRYIAACSTWMAENGTVGGVNAALSFIVSTRPLLPVATSVKLIDVLLLNEDRVDAATTQALNRARVWKIILMTRRLWSQQAVTWADATYRRLAPPAIGGSAPLAMETAVWRTKALAQLGRAAEVVRACDGLLVELDRNGDAATRLNRARLRLMKMGALADLSRFDEALETERAHFAEFGTDGSRTIQEYGALLRSVEINILVRQGKTDAALATSDRVLKHLTGGHTAASMGTVPALREWRANVALSSGRLDKASAEIDALYRFLGEPSRVAEETRSIARGRLAAVMEELADRYESAGDRKRAIIVYDRMRTALAGDEAQAETVLAAGGRRAIDLLALGETELALSEYDQLLAEAEKARLSSSNTALGIMQKKGQLLEERGLDRQADTVYAAILERGGDDERLRKDSVRRQLVLNALTRRAGYVAGFGKRDDAIALYSEAIRRFGNYGEESIRYGIAQSLLNRGALLSNLHRETEALADFQSVRSLFAADPSPRMATNLALAEVNAAHVLLNMSRIAEARAGLEAFLKRYPKPTPYVEAAVLEDARRLLREAR